MAGGLFVGGGRVERRLADGTLHAIIELPVSRPTMPMLGGADRKTLFITSQRRLLDARQLASEPLAGDLLAVRTDVAGVASRTVGIYNLRRRTSCDERGMPVDIRCHIR